tara:strand:- start:20 stop:370 length:351 start_codon:yes stop_codon:yes gene_type:complete
MNFYTKIIFFLTIFVVFSLTYLIERTNTTRAIQKVLIIVISSIMFLAIISPSTFVIGLANIMGVGRGPDSVFYLYIIVSLAINFILLKKISDNETRIIKLTQSIAINQIESKKMNM